MESSRVHHEIIPMETGAMMKAETKDEAKTTLQRDAEESAATTKNKKMYSVAGQVAQVILRALAAVCMMAAVIMMLFFTEESYSIGGYSITASYRSSSALEFFVAGCGVAGLYSILSLSFVHCSPKNRFLHAVDMLVTALAMAAFSAAAAVGYIGMYGNDAAGWPKVCNYTDRFCRRSSVAFGLSCIGFVALFFVSLLSSA